MADFDLDTFLPYQLDVVASRISREFAQIYRERFGISIPEWRVLAHLSHSGFVSVREIHLKVNMDKSKVSRAAARLEQSGLVKKSVNTVDRRLVSLELTDAGHALVEEIAPVARTFERRVLERIGPGAAAFRMTLSSLIESDAT